MSRYASLSGCACDSPSMKTGLPWTLLLFIGLVSQMKTLFRTAYNTTVSMSRSCRRKRKETAQMQPHQQPCSRVVSAHTDGKCHVVRGCNQHLHFTLEGATSKTGRPPHHPSNWGTRSPTSLPVLLASVHGWNYKDTVLVLRFLTLLTVTTIFKISMTLFRHYNKDNQDGTTTT